MAEQILAEVGTDVEKQFPSSAHLCSWAGSWEPCIGVLHQEREKNGQEYLSLMPF
ncbi:IS110 family transposase [Psychrobacillus vulpis]|uniref:IS110 family transposase n=1 Tax=Psychrobacillus vulpis TaxID=2325572 RepID=UPI001F0EF2A2|nr:IS110 family transposase [Psychrobacillus vulpis]